MCNCEITIIVGKLRKVSLEFCSLLQLLYRTLSLEFKSSSKQNIFTVRNLCKQIQKLRLKIKHTNFAYKIHTMNFIGIVTI